MLYETCKECKNFFIRTIEKGDFVIEDNAIAVTGKYQAGQYVKIAGSLFNDGNLYQIESIENGKISVAIVDENYPAWIQPSGGHDAYPIGARVSHNGMRYVSLINANVTVPGTNERYWETIHYDAAEHILTDESFIGTIAGLAIPRDFITLVDEITAFHEEALKTPNLGQVQSESFGGYSYSMAVGSDGLPATWKNIFASRLNPYRKMFEQKIL